MFHFYSQDHTLKCYSAYWQIETQLHLKVWGASFMFLWLRTFLADNQFIKVVESVRFLPQHEVQERESLDSAECGTVSKAAAKDLVKSGLSLPLLHCGPVEHVPHARRLLLEELAVLSTLLGPGRVERRGVLVHQVGVLGASGPTKVFDLMREEEPKQTTSENWMT